MPDSHRQTLLSPLALACFVLTAVIGFGLDQWSKREAFARLASGVIWVDNGDDKPKTPQPVAPKTVRFIPGLVNFTVTCNVGAVFGLGPGQRTLFIIVSAAAILFIGYLFLTSGSQRLYQIILGLLLAGVLGNLYDRIEFSYVRDMIHGLPKWPRLFPYIFNVADTLLCTGVGLMVVYSLFYNPEHARQRQQAAEPEAA